MGGVVQKKSGRGGKEKGAGVEQHTPSSIKCSEVTGKGSKGFEKESIGGE